jgi:hypothetical protein
VERDRKARPATIIAGGDVQLAVNPLDLGLNDFHSKSFAAGGTETGR